jgi:chemotaxis protein histidine kinase CheA
MAISPSIREKACQFFIQEAPELLQTIEQELLTLGQQRTPQKVHNLMRAAHSIKGGAANVGLQTICDIAHRLEDSFKALHNQEIVIDGEMEDLLLQGYDCLRIPLMDVVTRGKFNKTAAIRAAEPVLERLEARISGFGPVELPTAAELGVDMTRSIFEVDVAQGLTRMRAVVADRSHPELAGEVRAQAEVFVGLADLLELPGFGEIAHLTLQALNRHPRQAYMIAQVALEDLDRAFAAVMAGDRTRGGEPSRELMVCADLIPPQALTMIPEVPAPIEPVSIVVEEISAAVVEDLVVSEPIALVAEEPLVPSAIVEDIPAIEPVATVVEDIPIVEPVSTVVEELPVLEPVATVIEELSVPEPIIVIAEDIPAIEPVATVVEDIPIVEPVSEITEAPLAVIAEHTSELIPTVHEESTTSEAISEISENVSIVELVPEVIENVSIPDLALEVTENVSIAELVTESALSAELASGEAENASTLEAISEIIKQVPTATIEYVLPTRKISALTEGLFVEPTEKISAEELVPESAEEISNSVTSSVIPTAPSANEIVVEVISESSISEPIATAPEESQVSEEVISIAEIVSNPEPIAIIAEEPPILEPIAQTIEEIAVAEPIAVVSEEVPVETPITVVPEDLPVAEAITVVFEEVQHTESIPTLVEEIQPVEPVVEIAEKIQAVESIIEIVEKIQLVEPVVEITEKIQAVEPIATLVEEIQAVSPIAEASPAEIISSADEDLEEVLGFEPTPVFANETPLVAKPVSIAHEVAKPPEPVPAIIAETLTLEPVVAPASVVKPSEPIVAPTSFVKPSEPVVKPTSVVKPSEPVVVPASVVKPSEPVAPVRPVSTVRLETPTPVAAPAPAAQPPATINVISQPQTQPLPPAPQPGTKLVTNAPKAIEPPVPVLDALREEEGEEEEQLGTGEESGAARPSVRVDLDRLERLNNQVGELAIAQNGQALQNERLQSTVEQLIERLAKFRKVGAELQGLSDQMLTSPQGNARQVSTFDASFDSLELDQYSQLNLLLQSASDEMALIEESAGDIAIFAGLSNQSLERQRRMLKNLRDDLMWARMLPLSEILDGFPRALRE